MGYYQNEKLWWQSKTIWVNAITFLIGFLTLLMGQDWMADYPGVVSGIVMAIGICNVVLRSITDAELKLKK